MRLKGKRCLIVGGTSGIGLAAARRFVDEGAAVMVAGPTEASGAAPSHFCACDATQREQVEHLLQQTLAELGGLDVLFHVAGASGRKAGDGPLHECSDAGWRWTLDTNLQSVFLTNRAAIRHWLAAHHPGVILNLGSMLALAPSPRFFDTCAYTAAKGAVIAMSRLAATSYAADGIRVNVLAPGLIDTPMSTRAVNDPAIRQFLASKQPLGPGPGRPDDCAAAAVFLCSDEARFVTGVVLPVDGGWNVSDGPYGTTSGTPLQ
jgi:NAD(P)-dependent dehydrogenase (short-subunit alcohol dehydrogenase family)